MDARQADNDDDDDLAERALAQTRGWLAHAVVGLDLCPFARSVLDRGQVRFVASGSADDAGVQTDLARELAVIAAAEPVQLETTLLVCTRALADFDDFNQFLDIADDTIRAADLEGVIQVASFHPRYRFEGTGDDDVSNATNRSPWPVLQLLREDSVERGVAALDDPDAIYRANIETLERLGDAGWQALRKRWSA